MIAEKLKEGEICKRDLADTKEACVIQSESTPFWGGVISGAAIGFGLCLIFGCGGNR